MSKIEQMELLQNVRASLRGEYYDLTCQIEDMVKQREELKELMEDTDNEIHILRELG